MVVASPVRISKMLSSSMKKELIGDDMETAIFNESSSSIDYNHVKEEELAFCNRMACILTKSTDLPKICQTQFPSVVEAVDRKGSGNYHQSSFPQEQHDDEQHHDATMMRVVQQGNVSTSGIKQDNSYYVPPTSDR
mmetsp:Transcript_6854/g.11952  ORF Transcript_6854/g.11952 Transcript_6854/m.11952 type:complete len:136 (+) Transcript_6854:182-589(+)